ncbi:MAG: hypothetical protein EGR90_11460 [Lachnospiraceae bacterium]|nr:hypothetical protein [Lachnospiraceae bacterium]
MRIVQIKMGYSKEKMMPVPIEIRENGYRKEKSFVVPKEKSGNGYRKEKSFVVPKEKSGNGYRKEKEFLVPISKGIDMGMKIYESVYRSIMEKISDEKTLHNSYYVINGAYNFSLFLFQRKTRSFIN